MARRWKGEVIKVTNPRFIEGSPEHEQYKLRQKYYYWTTGDIQREKARERMQRKRERNQQYIVNKLAGKYCEHCGIEDIRVLAFDHLPGLEKHANVADLVSRGATIEKIQDEIDKCRVLCHNCHMIHTVSAHEKGWYKDNLKPMSDEEFKLKFQF